MFVQRYLTIYFRHAVTGHDAKMTVTEEGCSYYYLDAEPRWHMEVTHEEANTRFEDYDWLLTKGVKKPNENER